MKYTNKILNTVKELDRLRNNAYHNGNIDFARYLNDKSCSTVCKLPYKEYKKFVKAYRTLIDTGRIEVISLYF